jgi:hypothetical protein
MRSATIDEYKEILTYPVSEERFLYRQGMDFYLGITVPCDISAGIMKLQCAAEKGSIPAIIRLYMHLKERQPITALEWLQKGVDINDPLCCLLFAEAKRKSIIYSEVQLLDLYEIARQKGFKIEQSMNQLIKKLPSDLQKKWLEKISLY